MHSAQSLKQNTAERSVLTEKQMEGSEEGREGLILSTLTFTVERTEFLARAVNQSWNLPYCLGPHSPILSCQPKTVVCDWKRKICPNRGSKWGTSIGEEKEEGLIHLELKLISAMVGTTYMCSSSQSGLIVCLIILEILDTLCSNTSRKIYSNTSYRFSF